MWSYLYAQFQDLINVPRTLSFINLSYKRRIDSYIVSCDNGYCKSQKGSKKCVDNQLNASLCQHLRILRDKPELSDNFTSSENNGHVYNIDDTEQDSRVRHEADNGWLVD